MFSSYTPNLYPRYLPNGDIEAGEFHNTYLNYPPESRQYAATNFANVKILEFGEITFLRLTEYFRHCADYNLEHEQLRFYWDELDELYEKTLQSQIEQAYRYKELLEPLGGYANTKEYLLRALIRNTSLWTQFVSLCISNGTERSEERNTILEMEMIKNSDPSKDEEEKILEYLEKVWNSLEEQNWWETIVEWSETTAALLEHIKMILHRFNLIQHDMGYMDEK